MTPAAVPMARLLTLVFASALGGVGVMLIIAPIFRVQRKSTIAWGTAAVMLTLLCGMIAGESAS